MTDTTKKQIFGATILKSEDRESYRHVFGLTEDELYLETMEALGDLAGHLGYQDTLSEGFTDEYEIVYFEGWLNVSGR